MEKHTSLRLRSHHDENRKEVGGKTRPRSICQCHKRTIDKRLNLVALSARDEQIIALHLYFNAESAEGIGNDAQVAQRHRLNGQPIAHHRSHANERTHFNHIGKNAMSCSAQAFSAHDSQAVRRNARNVCSHAIEQMAKLLDIGLASCVVNGRCSLCQHRSHKDVGCTRHTGFVQKHISSLQVVRFDFKQLMVGICGERRP